MKKSVRLLALVLILATCLSGVSFAAYEGEITPYSNAYVRSVIAATVKSGTTITVYYTVYGTGIMDKIGASMVKIYTSGGTLVKTFWATYTPSMMGSNNYVYTGSVSFKGTAGKTYYAVVTAYANKNGGYGTIPYTTNSVTL